MKMICPNCGNEEEKNLWYYNNYACSKCKTNILGKAKWPINIFIPLRTAIVITLCVLLRYKLQNNGMDGLEAFMISILAFFVVDTLLFPIGTLALYKIFNKSK